MAKILQIGNYPPPACGWAIQTKLLAEEIRHRGHVCEVLNINESRKIKSSDYIDVQNGLDYVSKLCRFASRGYSFHVNVNGQSKPGYVLALIATLVAHIAGRPATILWRGGLQQKFFPRENPSLTRWMYQQLFRSAGRIACDSVPIKKAIEGYGIDGCRVLAIQPFSRQNLDFDVAPLTAETEAFLQCHRPVFFSYVSYRPEYQLPMFRKAMKTFRQANPDAGFIWLGFPPKEMPTVNAYVAGWPGNERSGLLLLGNLGHDQFLTLLSRCFAYVRTPACDGVASSVLESLALGVPVIASENGIRPPNVITYVDGDAADLCEKLTRVVSDYEMIKRRAKLEDAPDGIEQTADCLLDEQSRGSAPYELGLADVQ